MSDPESATGDRAPAGDFPRPIGFSETAAVAWTVYRARLRNVLPLLLGVYLIFSFAQFMALNTIAATSLSDAGQVALALIPGFVIPSIIASLLFASLALEYTDSLIGQPATTPGPRILRSRTGDLLKLGVLASFVFILVLFLGPIFRVFYPMFLGPPIFIHAFAVESLTASQAYRRGRTLLAGEWGRILLYLLPLAAIVGIMTFAVPPAAAAAAGRFAPDAVVIAVYLVAQGIAWALALPYMAAVGFASYLDLRARKDELDLNKLREERDSV